MLLLWLRRRLPSSGPVAAEYLSGTRRTRVQMTDTRATGHTPGTRARGNTSGTTT